jgi:hypothetical protein
VKFFNRHMNTVPGMEKPDVAEVRGRLFALSFG